jgi:hypothetical protein
MTQHQAAVSACEDGMMRIEKGSLRGLATFGTPEEWERFAAGLEDLYCELKHDVLPGADNPTAGGVIVNLKEALVIMAIVEDAEFTRSVIRPLFAGDHRES